MRLRDLTGTEGAAAPSGSGAAGARSQPLAIGWGGRVGRNVAYRLAGVTIVSARPVPLLRHLRVEAPGLLHTALPAPPTLGAGWTPVFEGLAPLGSEEVRVACDAGDAWLRLRIATVEPFLVARDGSGILCSDVAPEGFAAEALLGPVLILALALRGVFTLHASAVALPGGAVLFLGATGSGKSTLARAFEDRGWRRLADDILPIVPGIRPRADHRFPQLKLPADSQIATATSLPVALAHVYVVEPAPAGGTAASTALPPAQALAGVAAQTVAARLFEPALLDAHLGFCRSVADDVAVHRLTYPHAPASVDEVVALVESDVGLRRASAE